MPDALKHDISPRVALVVGGTRGIGRACAEALRVAGLSVAVTHRGAAVPGFLSVRCDVRIKEEIDDGMARIERELGPIQVVVVNAGIATFAPLAKTSDSSVADMLQTNVEGTIRVIRRAVRGMMRKKWGRIVLISSAAATAGASWGSVYAATKAAQIGLGRSLARELGPFGVTVNVVLPGLIATDLTIGRTGWLIAATDGPLRRIGQPEEVAAVVRFLASEDASYVTGALIPVDGGLTMGLG